MSNNPRQKSQDELRELIMAARTIALLGASANPQRPAFTVMTALVKHGFRVLPVNPGLAGQTLHGQTVFARLADIPEPIDIIDVFRNPDAVSGIVDESLALPSKPGTLWLQPGIRDPQAEARASAAGINVVTDHCTKIVMSASQN